MFGKSGVSGGPWADVLLNTATRCRASELRGELTVTVMVLRITPVFVTIPLRMLGMVAECAFGRAEKD